MRPASVGLLAGLLPFAVLEAQSGGTPTAKIVGVIADSVSGAPLRDADVIASGVAAPVKTDSLGRFEIDHLSPGIYQVGVFHPLLESLGITLATQPFKIGPDSAGVVNLAVPSVPTLVHRYCPDGQSSVTPAAIAGRVLDPDDDAPIPDAKVSLTWTEIFVSKTTGVVRTAHELHTESNSSGFFKLCALPTDLEGTLLVTRGTATSPEIPVSMNGALLDFQSISIPARDDDRPTGIVLGHVLSPAGKPVPNARVEIPMSAVAGTTREDGSFRLIGVHTGTQMLIARSISYSTAAEAINVTSREPLDVSMTLGDKVASLDTVIISARRNAYLEKNGFSARKKAGAGYFFTREDLDRRKPNAITDMVKGLPGVTVRSVTGGTVLLGRSSVTSFYSASSCSRAFIDGFEWRNPQPGDLDMIINPDDVVGIELYQAGNVPVKWRGLQDCLTLVVWTQYRGKAGKQ
ncbi:MAG: carboxypeptidase regulatory-like domain-containing protein [Gemmatimonadaceae bacterium]